MDGGLKDISIGGGGLDKSFQPLQVKDQGKFPEVVEKSVPPPNQSADVVVPFSDEKVHIVFSERRLGCDAALLLTIEPDGTEHITVTHYDPEHVEEHQQLIMKKKKEHPKGKRKTVLVTRGDDRAQWRKKLEASLKQYSGNNPDVISLPDLDESHLPEIASPDTRLNYQLVFVKGFGGDKRKNRVSVPATDYEEVFTAEEI